MSFRLLVNLLEDLEHLAFTSILERPWLMICLWLFLLYMRSPGGPGSGLCCITKKRVISTIERKWIRDGDSLAHDKLLKQLQSDEERDSERVFGPTQGEYCVNTNSNSNEGDSRQKRSRKQWSATTGGVRTTPGRQKPNADGVGPQGQHIFDANSEQCANTDSWLDLENLKRQVRKQSKMIKEQGEAIEKILQKLDPVELPRFCRWECISKALTNIVTSAFLGPGPECQFYPSEDDLIAKILSPFNITMEMQPEVEVFRRVWGKAGTENIQLRVSENIRDRRGAILRSLREEFYSRLGLPKPRKTEPEQNILKWKEDLRALKQGTYGPCWRVKHSDDSTDPWGSDPVHHSIARAIHGLHFDPKVPITINLKQAGFFFYNLELAIEGKVMEPGRMVFHHGKMAKLEESVKTLFQRDMKRIVITF